MLYCSDYISSNFHTFAHKCCSSAGALVWKPVCAKILKKGAKLDVMKKYKCIYKTFYSVMIQNFSFFTFYKHKLICVF